MEQERRHEDLEFDCQQLQKSRHGQSTAPELGKEAQKQANP